jgi:MFS family permease
LVKEFSVDFKQVSNWSGYQFWASGIAGLCSSAIAKTYGKRPVYLLSIILCFAGVLWNVFVNSPSHFLGARFVQGLGIGAFETIIPSSIGDMFFVHERGKRIAFYNLCFLGTTYFEPVLGGYISTKHGWRTQFAIISAFLGALLVLTIFLVPEHAYNRPEVFNTDTSSIENLAELDSKLAQARINPDPSDDEPKTPYLQTLRPISRRFSQVPLYIHFVTPLLLLLYPATIWCFLFQGTFITWGIAVSLILAQLLPTFNPTQLGYLYTAPFLGAVFSYVLARLLSDYLATTLSRRNNNTYEPEFRILLVIPIAFISLPGIYTFGLSATAQSHWFLPSFCYGLLTFGVIMSCTATFSYILDAHREVSVEMMVAVLLSKNLWAFGSTYFVNDWVQNAGAEKVFYIVGGVQTAVCVLSAGMYCWGKCIRAMVKKLDLIRRVCGENAVKDGDELGH